MSAISRQQREVLLSLYRHHGDNPVAEASLECGSTRAPETLRWASVQRTLEALVRRGLVHRGERQEALTGAGLQLAASLAREVTT